MGLLGNKNQEDEGDTKGAYHERGSGRCVSGGGLLFSVESISLSLR